MSESKDLTGVYLQLFQHRGSTKAIKELLDEVQGQSDIAKKEINVGGKKVEKLQSLRRACSLGFLDQSRVDKLLIEIEEYGHQTIYFFKPRNKEIKDLLSDGPEVATRMFDSEWGENYFPKLERSDKTLQWVDCRINLSGGDWVLKAYGHERREETVEPTKAQHLKNNRIKYTRVTETSDVNTVIVVRWRNKTNWLEIRVHKYHAGQNGVNERFKAIKKMLAPLVSVDRDLLNYSFAKKLSEMLANRPSSKPKEKKKVEKPKYQVGTVNVKDAKNGVNSFKPLTTDESIDDDKGRTASVESLLKNGGKPFGLGLKWFKVEGCPDSMPDSLLTHIQGNSSNTISIQQSISSDTYEYVLKQLESGS